MPASGSAWRDFKRWADWPRSSSSSSQSQKENNGAFKVNCYGIFPLLNCIESIFDDDVPMMDLGPLLGEHTPLRLSISSMVFGAGCRKKGKEEQKLIVS